MFIYSLFYFFIRMNELIRPTQVDREKYIAFGNKCRTENKDIRETLNALIDLYLVKGDSLF